MEQNNVKDEGNLILKNIALAIGYFILAKVAFSFAFEHGQVSPIWPPAGLAFAAVFICRYKYVPGLFAGAFLTNFVQIIFSNHPWSYALIPSALIGIGNVLEAIIGVHLFKNISKEEFIFSSTKSVLLFPILSGLACLIAAAIGVSTLTYFEVAPKELFLKLFITWSVGDIGGILTVAPIFIFFKRYGLNAFRKDRVKEFIIYLISSAPLTYIVFLNAFASDVYTVLIYLVIPLITFTAIRLGQVEVALINGLVSIFAILGSLRGLHTTIPSENINVVLVINVFIFCNFVTGFLTSSFWEDLKISKLNTLQLAKFSGLGDVAGKLAHEIGNPIHLILNFTEIIERELKKTNCPDSAQKIENSLGKIKEYAGRTQDIIKKTREINTNHQLQKKVIQVKDSVEKAIELLAIKSNKYQIEVNLVEREKNVTTLGDSHYLEQAFYNILNNSVQAFIKYDEENIGLSSKEIKTGVRRIEILIDRKKNFSVVQFSDNGPGIPDEVFNKIFTPYFSESKEGMGLGLTIVSSIIHAHGGEIQVTQNKPTGAIFMISLPLAEQN